MYNPHPLLQLKSAGGSGYLLPCLIMYVSVYNTQSHFTAQICGNKCGLYTVKDGMSDLRKGDLFVLSWAKVGQVRWGSISSELLMCGGDVCSILLYLVARCLEILQ